MSVRHVLAVVDFSSAGLQAAWRAARIAWARGAELRLLTLVQLPDRHPTSRHGASAVPVMARADMHHLAEQIQASIGLQPQVLVGIDEEGQAALRSQAEGACLVVVPGNAVGLAERILRQQGAPVFLVRRAPGAVHRRVMAVVDADTHAAGPLLRAAHAFCAPEALLACQMLDPSIQHHLHAADLPAPTVQAWLETAAHRARVALAEQLARTDLGAAHAVVLRGDALTQLSGEQQRRGASLLVVGKPRRGWWADWLRPSLARQLADRVTCDVLWLPTPAPSAQAARQRLGNLYAASR